MSPGSRPFGGYVRGSRGPRVKRVIAINPYDYGQGMGIARANGWAWLTSNLANVPVLGETVMRLRNRFIEQRILEGSVANPEAITPGFGAQVRASGLRPRSLSRLPQPAPPCLHVCFGAKLSALTYLKPQPRQ
jgi:hypothetical protein